MTATPKRTIRNSRKSTAPIELGKPYNCPQVELIDPRSLRPWPGNARTHSRKQVNQLVRSINEFGFTSPVLTDDQGVILAGHGRVLAALELGLGKVPTIPLKGLSEAQKRAYVLADNKIALNAGWDEGVLAQELQGLLQMDLGFDLQLTGFSIPEVDSLIDGLAPKEAGDPIEDSPVPPFEGPPRSRLGDLWQLGPHRVVCGDATDPATYTRLMDGAVATAVFTDPPYNVPVAGHVGGLGKTKHREFAMASGEMSPEQFIEFLRKAFLHLIANSKDGSIHFICMDWRHMCEMLDAGGVYTELKNLCVWAKDKGGMGTFYRSRHELIFVFKNGNAQHINSFELGQHGRYRTNVWEYRGINTLKTGHMDELALHPTVKPVGMIADAIKDVTKRNDVILDAFGGSGSTIIAAHKTGRRGYLIELDPIYVDRIIMRWQAYARDDAILVATGETFDDLAFSNVRGEG
jgi:DNA modification methylase